MTLRTHSKAYLDSLLHPPISSGTIGSRPTTLTRTASGIGLSITDAHQYKPTKSSGLAVGGNEEKKDGSDEDEEEDPEMKAVMSGAISLDSASEDEEYDPSLFLHVQTMSTRSSLSSSSASQSVQVVLNLLDDEDLDDEERIERVRFTLAARLSEIEGGPVSAARLDNIVLSLLHRHREDIRPTGASFALPASPSPSPFPASPRSRPRPASLRSMSGTNSGLSRPWTPNLPVTPTGSTFPHDNGPSVPSSPMLIPQALSTIGNGSPRASPSLWHRSLSNSTSIAATSNPWSASSPISVPSPYFAPLGPPGDTIGSPPKSFTSNTSASLLGTSVATMSRPSSPGNTTIDSPRLNVAALEFKPRTASQQQVVTPQKPVPWLADESELTGIKTSEDSDEDEFSPFASQGVAAVSFPGSSSSSSASSSRLAASRARPISGASGHSSIQSLTTAESISGSYHGSTTSASLESSDNIQRGAKWAGGVSIEDDKDATPFDILTSLLSSSQLASNSWTTDQLKEALEVNNYDIDSTLAAMMKSGGISSGVANIKAKSPGVLSRPAASGLTIVSPSPRGGVSIASRDSFVSQRGAGSTTPGIAGSPASTSTLASQQMQQQQGGGVGPGRVCRYFLAGECRRADCRFSHDLNRAICRFWIKGQCLNGEGCSFLHDKSIVEKLQSRLNQSQGGTVSGNTTPADTLIRDEFPELLMAPTGPKAQRVKGMAGNANERSRWAQGPQKRGGG